MAAFLARMLHPFGCWYEPMLWDKFGTGRRDQVSRYERCIICGRTRDTEEASNAR